VVEWLQRIRIRDSRERRAQTHDFLSRIVSSMPDFTQRFLKPLDLVGGFKDALVVANHHGIAMNLSQPLHQIAHFPLPRTLGGFSARCC